MTLTQLMYIVAVEKYRHFGTAAEKSFVTQPTLSMQIHKLEEELGLKIFDRSKSPVVPTPVGARIVEKAREVLQGGQAIEDLARAADDRIRGVFRIGVVSTVAPYLLPLFLKPFMDRYPDVTLVFEEGLTREILEGIADDRLDAGIIASPPDIPNVLEKELFLEPFTALVPKDHSLRDAERLSVSQVNPEELLLLDEGHCFRDQAVKLCSRMTADRPARVQFRSGNLETLKRLVERDYGVTLLPWLAMNGPEAECGHARAVPFEAPEPCRRIRIAYSREYLERNFIKALQEVILSHIPPELKDMQDTRVIE